MNDDVNKADIILSPCRRLRESLGDTAIVEAAVATIAPGNGGDKVTVPPGTTQIFRIGILS